MAGLRFCHNLLFGSKNEVVRAFNKGNSTLIPFLVVFWTQIFASTQNHTLLLTLIPSPLDMYTNVDLQKAIRLVLKLFVKS